MWKQIIAGISVGIANAIPGVSGGTMLVISGVFEKTTTAIGNLVSKDKQLRKSSILFLLQLAIGVAIGIIVFSKLLNAILLRKIPVETIFWFMGMVVYSVPIFLKKEMNNEKLNVFFLILGLLTIAIITFLAPSKKGIELDVLPPLTLIHSLVLILIGFIAGFTMIIPGVSGSMVLLILGQYYLFTTYVAKVTTFRVDIIIALVVILIGALLGILVSSKLCSRLFKEAPSQSKSYVLGLIIASAIALFPYKTMQFDVLHLLGYVAAFGLGIAIVWMFDRISKS